MKQPTLMSSDELTRYRAWLIATARLARGRLRDFLTSAAEQLDGQDWSYLP